MLLLISAVALIYELQRRDKIGLFEKARASQIIALMAMIISRYLSPEFGQKYLLLQYITTTRVE